MYFPGMKISAIQSEGDRARIEVDYAIIVKNMDDAEQDTRWYGKGVIRVEDLSIDSETLPDLPATVKSADVKDNALTYRDQVQIPIHFHGNTGITLTFEGFDQPVRFIGERMSFDLSEHEKYIEHIPR
jgi:hypothetical protein